VAQLSLLEHSQSVQNTANRDLLRLMNHTRRATIRSIIQCILVITSTLIHINLPD